MSQPLHVIIAGGGFAAVETVLALKAFAAERVAIELVAPEPRLHFRPAASIAPFSDGAVQRFELAALAGQTGALLREDRLQSVNGDARSVRLASGARRDYDVLVLALGARARAALPGAVTFRDQRDRRRLERVLRALRGGELDALAIAIPAGLGWTLPAYEIALLAAAEAQELGLDTQITLITPEPAPLAVFGPQVSDEVGALLAARGVDVACDAVAVNVDRRGVQLDDGRHVAADHVIASALLAGPGLPGVPADGAGFVPTRAFGEVDGRDDVFAAGDIADFPVKQGGLAAQQAEAVAAEIARRAGAHAPRLARTTVLRAQLFGAPEPLYLEATLDPRGQPLEGRTYSEAPWWPQGTLFGRHVTPWMAEQTLA